MKGDRPEEWAVRKRVAPVQRVGDAAENWVVGADRDLPIDTTETWDGDRAKETIFSWAENSDGEIDASKAKRGFLIYDEANSELRGAYKLPFAHYIGGLKASPAGLRAAASRLPQTDAPQDTLDRARAVLDHYFDQMEEEAGKMSARRADAHPHWMQKTVQLAEVGDDRTAQFIASSNREDRYGDVIEQNWDTEDFFRNPVFLWGHQSWEPPIGWVRDFRTNVDATLTTARVEFFPEDINPWANNLFKMTKAGGLRAVSVGFIPMEMEDRFNDDKEWIGWRFIKSKLIELSLCTVPANPDAVMLAKSIDPHPAFLRRVFSDMVRAPVRPRSAPALEHESFSRRTEAQRMLERFKAKTA